MGITLAETQISCNSAMVQGLEPLTLPEMFPPVTIRAKGKTVFDSVFAIFSKMYLMMDFKIG